MVFLFTSKFLNSDPKELWDGGASVNGNFHIYGNWCGGRASKRKMHITDKK